ncbi:MAG: TldD/PmbA family protein [Candidatus Heimdallarchaeota archaeon]|nr:TldD/PmbA family protein [Candidatus Heimdallarchaeota archaeon]
MDSEQTNTLTLDEIIDKSMQYLEKTNPDDIIVYGSDEIRFQLRFSKNDIIVSKRWANVQAGFFYVKDKKIATTDISDISSMEAVYKSLDELITFGKAIPPKDDYGGIAKGPFQYKKLSGLYDPDIVNFHEKAVDQVEEGLNAAIDHGAKHSAGILVWGYSRSKIKTNNDVEFKTLNSSFEFLIRSFLEPTESGQGLSVGRMLNSLNTQQAGQTAGEIAFQSKGGRKGEPGKYDALLSPTVVADIVGATIRGANPFSIDIGRSWLKDKIGDKVASEKFTAYDDATVPNGIRSRFADIEGVPSQQTTLFENGVLKGLIHNTSTAKKLGTTTTSNAGLIIPSNTNILIEPGIFTFEELIRESKKPTILVTSNWYTRTTNAAEGIFSTIPRDGMFLIENGEIQRPIRELRITDTFPNLVKNISAIQNKTRQIKWWLEVTIPTFAPAMLIEGVNFTTGTK